MQEKIKSVIADYFDVEELDGESKIVSLADGELDVFVLLNALELEFGIIFEDEEGDYFYGNGTVNELIELVEKKIG